MATQTTTSAMPAAVFEVFDALRDETFSIHARWICYRQLFGTSERRFQMINECASTFFYFIHETLVEGVQISLTKLSDPAKTGAHENLSLEQLQSRLEAHVDQALAHRTRPLLDIIHSRCDPFRTWRNKKLAHLDLSTALKLTVNPLAGISRQMVEDALSCVCDYLNAIEQHYFGNSSLYSELIMSDDGNTLVLFLKRGLRYKELVLERKIPFEDFGNGKWSDA